MTTKITWNFIEFEKSDEFDCIDGITKESEVEFHIWKDEEVIFGKPDNYESNYNNISIVLQELIEITKLAELFHTGKILSKNEL